MIDPANPDLSPFFMERFGENYVRAMSTLAAYHHYGSFVALILLQAAERDILEDVLWELESHKRLPQEKPSRMRRLLHAVIGNTTDRFLDRLFRSLQEPPTTVFVP